MIGLKRGTVSLCPHDPNWVTQAEETIAVLQEVFGSLAVDIQHIGSTAIEGIAAKPILDIAVGVRSFEGLPLAQLEERGFQVSHNRFSSDLLYVREHTLENGERVRTHQIHILIHDGLQWHNYVDFRDYMNAHPEKAADYERLKRRLEAACNNVQTAYTDGKHDYMEQALADARAWKQRKDESL